MHGRISFPQDRNGPVRMRYGDYLAAFLGADDEAAKRLDEIGVKTGLGLVEYGKRRGAGS